MTLKETIEYLEQLLFDESLSPEVKSAEDVGVKGELAGILDTFEPNLNF